ncbi:uncharacterized protein LOC123551417 [Mercenaria mercenaria]|uniref:uncharacterized protein LOC123551417 n=1 Tax=Mercenaria mercenaria TaxID=6596 RepID=UPI00234EE233|nr:uncharacterized protein LOC123551417 [Mercenaria mercenaria]
MFHMITEEMHQQYRWTRTYVIKTVVLAAILLVSLQYLVNVAIFRRKESITFLKLLDSSVENMLNQTGLKFKERIHDSVTKMEKPLELCPVIPPKLKGHIKVNAQVAAWAYIEQENAVLSPGGRYKPTHCLARHRVAIVVPYRDREIHLKIFLKNIHPFLQSQQLDYGIFVVEMAQDIKFNRALLMNVGFVEAMKQYDYQCFVFHDVDLLPEDDRNLYTCPQFPRHMSVAIDRLQYKLPYSQIFGGVSAMTTEHFKKINGFSNIFFGWGGEDDDMYRRILYSNLTVIRYSPEVARYKMLIHAKDNQNSDRFMLLRTVKARRKTDGITSLKYKIEKTELRPLYTWILVSVNMTEILDAEPIHKSAYMNLRRSHQLKKVEVDKPQHNNLVHRKVVQKVNQGKVVQSADKKQINETKIAQPDDKTEVNQEKVVQVDEVKKGVNQGKVVQVVEAKEEVNQGKVVQADNENNRKQVSAAVKQEKYNVDNNNPVKTKDSVYDAKVNVKKNPVSVQKQQPNAPKLKLTNGLAKRKRITMVSWIPSEFNGILPTNLTKFEPLPIIVPAHTLKRKVNKHHPANRHPDKKKTIRYNVNAAKRVKIGTKHGQDKKVLQHANTGDKSNGVQGHNINIHNLHDATSKDVPKKIDERIQDNKAVR